MLEYAFDKNGNLVYIEDAVNGQEYFCPDCNEKLTKKNRKFEGRIKDYHYAHKSGSDCIGNHTGESDLHRNTKLLIYKILSESKNLYLRKKLKVGKTYCMTEYNALEKVDEVVLEKRSLDKFIPDISLKSQNKLLRAVEIIYKHEDEPEKQTAYKENRVDVLKVYTDEIKYTKLKATLKPEIVIQRNSKRLYLLKPYNPSLFENAGKTPA